MQHNTSHTVLRQEIGIVRSAKHYLVSIEGLPSARVHDIVYTEEGGRALVTTLAHDAVEAMVLDPISVRPGQNFFMHDHAKQQLSVGEHLFGRVINALGDPIDGKTGFPAKNAPLILEQDAGDLARRAAIKEQLQTGFSIVDTVLPIGRGQRQLLMGPIQSGIDTFCRALVANQRYANMICIYVTIGKPVSYVRRLASSLLNEVSGAHTFMLASTSEDPAPLNAITPSVATYLAEHFCEKGKHVLLILDDLYTHAKFLREIALLEGRLPGRESYPGDIFYQQAHLMERAGNFANKGSITLLPILQTDPDASVDLIMTNIMGTTDGHLLFSPSLFAQGVFPAILEEQSVTRVGKHTQSIVHKQLSTSIMALLTEAKEQERFVQFGTQVSEATETTIAMGKIIRSLLNQPEGSFMTIETQVLLFSLMTTSFSSGKDEQFFHVNQAKLAEVLHADPQLADLRDHIHTEQSLDSLVRMLEKRVSFFESICQK